MMHFTEAHHEGELLYPFLSQPTVGTVGVAGGGCLMQNHADVQQTVSGDSPLGPGKQEQGSFLQWVYQQQSQGGPTH